MPSEVEKVYCDLIICEVVSLAALVWRERVNVERKPSINECSI
jgi:hypothetical protein